MEITSERALVAAAAALGARRVPVWSEAEEGLVGEGLPVLPDRLLRALIQRIRQGGDPLGEELCRLRSPGQRRDLGATYTPLAIVDAMLEWIAGKEAPDRVVDPGAGSARFLVRAGLRFPAAQLVGVEIDPTAAILARANLAVAGLADRSRILVDDYRAVRLPEIDGRTAYVGNPPYVRHHRIEPEWKRWLSAEAAKRRLRGSQLAGLHVHFLLATLIGARPGDYGSLITAAEWLDVNYGQLVRELFVGELGGESLILIDPKAQPFPDAATTAAITNFEVGAKPRSVRLRRVDDLRRLGGLGGGRAVARERLQAEQRWSQLTRVARRTPPGYLELGELFRVHRGQVTGANRIWTEGPHSAGLPDSVLVPTVTRARELIEAGLELRDASGLKRVIDLPVDLGSLSDAERDRVETFLRRARLAGAHRPYVARNRKAWWSVGLKPPAPILATYMARRPPAFVLNTASARHLNIAHGLYPREPVEDRLLFGLVSYLAGNGAVDGGRTYAGGLTKFEPREMERIAVPAPEVLVEWAP